MKRAMTITYEVENGLYINMTNRCSNSCEFCIRKNGDGAYGSDSLWLEHEPSVSEIEADVIHTLTGLTVISVPGVNTLSHLKATLEEMKSRGLKEVKTAFDMDMMTNHNVRNGFINLLSLLDSMDFNFGTYVWDARYKGLDDYVYNQNYRALLLLE